MRGPAARMVLVGCGHLGRFHLQKLLAMREDVVVVAVVEPDVAHAGAAQALVTAAYGAPCPVVPEVQAFVGEADAAIIAAPTVWHHQLTFACLTRNWHVLVEKPMATNLLQARAMWAEARARQLVLQVGHLERFNPAIEVALAHGGEVRYLTAERLAPFTGRATDVDVVLDLMIHDLDLLAAFGGGRITEVRALGMPVLTGSTDMATARIETSTGLVAQLAAGRTSMRPSRKLRLFSTSGYTSIDCAHKTVMQVRRAQDAVGQDITAEALVVPVQDALEAQDRAFVHSITTGAAVRVDGGAGLAALEAAEAVKATMAQHALQFPLQPPSELQLS